MNIRNDLQPIQPVDGSPQTSPIEKAPAVSNAAPIATTSDQAHVSGTATLISHAVSVSDVRSEKVQSIQAAIASGNYSVSSADVAHSLIHHMLGNQD